MYSLVLNGESISVSKASLFMHCQLFRTKPGLLGQPYRVESSVSLDSLRVFVGAIGGAVAEVSDANIRDLSQLCDEFNFIELARTVGDWQAEHAQIDAVIRRELDLVRAALEERFESQVRTMLMLDQAQHRLREDGVHDAENPSAMEAEVSGLRSLLGETSASVEKAARDIDQVKAAAATQWMAHGRDICALEEEMRRVGKAIEVLANVESKYEKLREIVATQGDELAETRRQNLKLGGACSSRKKRICCLRQILQRRYTWWGCSQGWLRLQRRNSGFCGE
jgi:hypothetical protein